MGMRRLRLSCPPGARGKVLSRCHTPERRAGVGVRREPPRSPGRAISTLHATRMAQRPNGHPLRNKMRALPGKHSHSDASSSATQPTTFCVVLWLCVPGSLRVCPFGGTPRYSINAMVPAFNLFGKSNLMRESSTKVYNIRRFLPTNAA